MHLRVSALFNDGNENVLAKVIGIYILLARRQYRCVDLGIAAFPNFPVLFGTAALAYSFGLRHAFDTDGRIWRAYRL